ncbi:MAG: RsmB/NOP family class I SAM-dependent RNA methyltransferase [Clostridia bacterium]|nr:RsmB/NOP family class I SAM-dependent RNA methyltransferase [Clostridia bacterium]
MNEQYPLPIAFVRRMQEQLGPDAAAYFAAMEEPWHRGLRLNPMKPLPADHPLHGDLLEPVPWHKGGWYLSNDSTLGAHPLHEAGAYYIQEPSAMTAVSVLAPKPGERVLDLCAAPGGKSTQIAGMLAGEGLLVCNEPVPSRSKILSRNIERMGIGNALVVSADPDQLCAKWQNCFDAILVDAPCSGEGMFRRHPETRLEWNEQSPAGCAARQSRILNAAVQMLKPGGRLVYSTCTLNLVENEQMVEGLLAEHPELSAVAFSLVVENEWGAGGLSPCRAWAEPTNERSAESVSTVSAEGARCAAEPLRTMDAPDGMLHLYPHQFKGEGHFVAQVRKAAEDALGDDSADATDFLPAAQQLAKPDKAMLAAYAAFVKSFGGDLPEANAQFGDMLIAAPDLPPLKGLKVLRAGLQLGSMKGKIFMPDHALAMGLTTGGDYPTVAVDESQAAAYQRGETLPVPDDVSGYCLVTLDGLALGFGKASGGQVKNHYPKGLRRG